MHHKHLVRLVDWDNQFQDQKVHGSETLKQGKSKFRFSLNCETLEFLR